MNPNGNRPPPSYSDTKKTVSVNGLEMFHKTLESGQAGDQCGILLKGVKKGDVQRGQVLSKPGEVKVYNKFEADLYVLKTEEGGRKKPFFTSYRPQAFIRTGTTTVNVTLPDDVEMAMPGDRVKVSLDMEKPFLHSDSKENQENLNLFYLLPTY